VWPKFDQIKTKFGVPGVLMKAIKSCKFQLDWDDALGEQGVSKNPIVHFIIQFPLKLFFSPISFSVQESVDPKEHFRPLKQKSIFDQKWKKTMGEKGEKKGEKNFFSEQFYFLHDILYR
jgi:hypothetical protein